MHKKSWIAQVTEADDGSGDSILTFPDELLDELGWKEGTELILQVEESVFGNILVITEKKI